MHPVGHLRWPDQEPQRCRFLFDSAVWAAWLLGNLCHADKGKEEMNILIYLDKGAQQFDANGFHYVAAGLRAWLAQEIQRADRNTFFEWVLGLPHAVEDVEAIYFDGVQITPNEYLEALGKQCDCGQHVSYGNARVWGCGDRASAFRAGMAERARVFGNPTGPITWAERQWHEATLMRGFAKYSSHPVTPEQLKHAADELSNLDNSWECLQTSPGTLCQHEFCKPQ